MLFRSISGWKLDQKTGEIEISSAQIQAGSLPADPQLITITAGQWSDYDLPTKALEHYAFIGAELIKIPTEYRDSAELSTEDCSFYRDGSDIRTTLTYERRETAEEVAARQQKTKVAGVRIHFKNGLTTVTADGVVRYRFGDLSKTEPAEPFVVVDDQVSMSEAYIEAGTVTKLCVAPEWSVKMELRNGKYIDRKSVV